MGNCGGSKDFTDSSTDDDLYGHGTHVAGIAAAESNNGEGVAAPGLYIYSTFPTHAYYLNKSLYYDYGSGTSMATPFVSGLAGLLFGQDPSRTNSDVRGLIEDGADPIPGTGTYWIHGRINALNAINEEPQPGGTMHVLGVDMWSSTTGKNYHVTTSVNILDENLDVVSAASVDLTTTLPDGTVVDVSEVTGVDGTVTFTLKSKQTGTYVSSLTDLTHPSYTYDPSNNVQIDESLKVP